MVYKISLFLIGLAAGSFLNVLSLRYKEGGRLFTKDVLFGKSHCPHCGENLRWYELIPLVSFATQLGRCRSCQKSLTWQYPMVELLGGAAFALVPFYANPAPIAIFIVLTLILIALIDGRLSVIPDQLNLFLGLLGIALIAVEGIGAFSIWRKHLAGGLLGLATFGLIIVLTKGRAMGIGDLKMAAALGFLFGWKKIILISALAFVIGGLWSSGILLLRKKSLKDKIPFGPFLSLAGVLVLFLGEYIIRWYGR